MIRRTRIATVYRKELLEILRDHRTIIAMIVVPVVLYPLLMVGFVWAAQRDEAALQAETFLVEVEDQATRDDLLAVIGAVNQAREAGNQDRVNFDIRIGHTPPEALGDDVQLRVVWSAAERMNDRTQVQVMIHFNEVSARSRTAIQLMKEALREFEQQLSRRRLAGLLESARPEPASPASLDAILHPVVITQRSSATEQQRGGWALGQIVPIILVLMTITGAVYPAIDLTAGERERGTLETLIVSPVPILDLIVGKFLVVATLAMAAAILNIASVGATMHFGGLTRALTQEMPVELPLAELPIILVCMIPFTLLFSAIMLAVCSFARTFKEAQNYVMPVIIGAMIPAAISSLPGIQLKGAMLVLPVGNMVLLTRELFQHTYTWSQVLVVMLSTSLYAAAAIAAATRLFGQEAVLFADSASYKSLLQRRLFRPSSRPTHTMALLLAALLFPAVFYTQSLLGDADHFLRTMSWLAVVQFIGFFMLLPLALVKYLKIDPGCTFQLRLPGVRICLAAVLLGVSTWALAHEFSVLQQHVLPPSRSFVEFSRRMQQELVRLPLGLCLLLLAVLPGVTEEFLFRGFVLSGLSSSLRKWPAIITTAAIFGLYHFALERLVITAGLGVILGYLCWKGGSIWPCMLLHALHNSAAVLLATQPRLCERLGLAAVETDSGHLPVKLLITAGALFVAGLVLAASARRPDKVSSEPQSA